MLSEKLPESSWQKFFSDNTWIFGYGLRYDMIDVLKGLDTDDDTFPVQEIDIIRETVKLPKLEREW